MKTLGIIFIVIYLFLLFFSKIEWSDKKANFTQRIFASFIGSVMLTLFIVIPIFGLIYLFR